jgi:hypothetical protein
MSDANATVAGHKQKEQWWQRWWAARGVNSGAEAAEAAAWAGEQRTAMAAVMGPEGGGQALQSRVAGADLLTSSCSSQSGGRGGGNDRQTKTVRHMITQQTLS